MDYDLIVIGGGAAGLGAARAARERNASVAIVSEGPLGGDCTWTGCVPSKTLIEAARAGLPFGEAMGRVKAAVKAIAGTEDADALAAEGIDTIRGRAAFTGPKTVAVGAQTLSGGAIVIATGSAPVVPPIPGLDAARVHTNETVFDLTSQPLSLVVLGGGAIGCELAQALSRLGTRVTVVEAAERLLPREEPEASAVIREVFEREGITVRTGVKAEKVEPGIGTSVLVLDDGSTVETECLLAALGRRAVTDGLGLERIGVETDERGNIRTDDRLRSTAPDIWAAGDITGLMPFTHAAFEQGRIAANNALGKRQRYRPEHTPWVTFTDPEVARVGISEAEAAEQDGRVAYLPMSEMDRAITADATDGFVKLIAGPRFLLGHRGGGKVLGATVVAERAGEMIHTPALAMARNMFTGRLAQTTTAYPTWSYAIQLAAAQFFNETGGRTARQADRDALSARPPRPAGAGRHRDSDLSRADAQVRG